MSWACVFWSPWMLEEGGEEGRLNGWFNLAEELLVIQSCS